MMMDNDDLQRMNKVLRHRLRNFASGIKSTAVFLSKELEGRLAPPEMEYFPLILHECDALSELTGRFNLLFDEMPPGGTMVLGDLFRTLASRLHDRFPTSPVCVQAEEGALETPIPMEQYLSIPLFELLTNAAEAAPSKDILLACAWEDETLVFRVTDQGPGLGRDMTSADLFKPFMTTKAKHLGMGLAIAVRLAAKAGGQLSVELREQGGLQFVLKWPLKKASE
ncbi:MAG: sensor histidine kinase [Lentisphaerota bacterium]